MKKYCFILFITLFIQPCIAGNLSGFKQDTSALYSIVPKEEAVNAFKTDKDFNYVTEDVPAESFFDKVMKWLNDTINSFFSDEGAAPYIRYSIIAALIVFVVLQLMNVKARRLFFKNQSREKALFTEEEIDLQQADFDSMIKAEIAKANYREAIRFLYLKMLKLLSNRNYIELLSRKTNSDFMKELEGNAYAFDFLKLSRIFEFVWYGNFLIKENVFEKIHDDFRMIFNKLND